jgi:hypothetical protein
MLEAIGELGWGVLICFPVYLIGLAQFFAQWESAALMILYFVVAATCAVVAFRKTPTLTRSIRVPALSFVLALLFGPGVFAMGASAMGPNALFLASSVAGQDVHNIYLNLWLLFVHWLLFMAIWCIVAVIRGRRAA